MTVNDFYKSIFHEKTYKISLKSGCTCPNRDGTLDTRGCIFCSPSGSGDFTAETIEDAKKIVAGKIKNPESAKYIAYFQNFTNTYGDLSKLEKQWKAALNSPQISGLAIATRPDCLSTDCLQVLGNIANQTFLQVELGFQTCNEETAQYIRRGFSNEVYIQAVRNLHKSNPNIHVVTHIIFGLPGDTFQDMMKSIRTAIEAGSDGIKITSLYILKGTDLEKEFYEGKVKPLSEDEYFTLLKEAFKIIPKDIIIHRLTGDPPKALLLEPKWTMNKKKVLNKLNELLDYKTK